LSTNELQELLRRGIAAARAGSNPTARRLLEQAIQLDENNETAWLWLATVVRSQSERRICLRKVLEINPDNNTAREALRRMGGEGGGPEPVAGVQRQPQRAARGTETGGSARGGSPRGGGAPSLLDRLLLVGIIAAVLVLVGLLGNLVNQPATPPPAAVIAVTPSRTPIPSATPTRPFRLVTPDAPTLPPTFTPTFTPPPSETPVPSPTPLGLDRFVVYMTVRELNSGRSDLYRLVGDSDTPELVARDVRDVSFSRDGRTMAFVRSVSYRGSEDEDDTAPDEVDEVFVAPVDDPQDAQQVTRVRLASASQPVLSPNGEQVIFTSDFDGDDELWLIDIATQVTSQLTDNTFTDRDPSWSRNGIDVIFASDAESPGFMDIYKLTFNLEAQGDEAPFTISRLTDDDGSSYAPAYAPDGTQIVYLNDASGDADLMLMPSSGSGSRPLLVDDFEERSPSWAPTARMIAFASNRQEGRFLPYTLDIDTRQVELLSQDVQGLESVVFWTQVR